MLGAYLGPACAQGEIDRRVADVGARFDSVDQATMLSRTARDLADGRAVGWFQGQFGPRALGARLILGDARSPSMQRTLNLRVKHRVIPPVCTIGLERTCQRLVRDRCGFPSHADGGRCRQGPPPRHVSRGTGPLRDRQAQCHSLGDPGRHARRMRFRDLLGCPVIVNTSFNVRGEPIVCTPEDAFRCAPGGRPSHAEQGAAGPRAPPGLQKCLGARLIGSDGNCRLAARSRQRCRRQICARASGPAPCGSQLAPALRQSRRRLLPIAPWPWPQLRCRAAAH
jgi:Carbamoyltransferase C-terminus